MKRRSRYRGPVGRDYRTGAKFFLENERSVFNRGLPREMHSIFLWGETYFSGVAPSDGTGALPAKIFENDSVAYLIGAPFCRYINELLSYLLFYGRPAYTEMGNRMTVILRRTIAGQAEKRIKS